MGLCARVGLIVFTAAASQAPVRHLVPSEEPGKEGDTLGQRARCRHKWSTCPGQAVWGWQGEDWRCQGRVQGKGPGGQQAYRVWASQGHQSQTVVKKVKVPLAQFGVLPALHRLSRALRTADCQGKPQRSQNTSKGSDEAGRRQPWFQGPASSAH